MGATPEGIGHYILLNVEMTLNARINIVVHFCITTLTLAFLEVAKNSPPSPPPKSTTATEFIT